MSARASQCVYVVSGLPRSGTSMMMRMLKTGGLPVLEDGRRPADADNQRGYFELEAVKRLVIDGAWVRAAQGKVVKVISYLLPYLPDDLDYRVVFMRRELDQVVRSQRAMLERLGGDPGSDQEARAQLADHLVDVETWLEGARHMAVLGVGYARVLAEPEREARRVAAFISAPLDLEAMVRSVEPALCHQG